MPKVTGTFAATGQSAALIANNSYITVSLAFAGAATVTLQRSFDGSTWKNVKTYTASAEENGFEPASGVSYRLNCTAYTNDVVYAFGTKD